MQEGKPFSSGKHKVIARKVKASKLLDRPALFCNESHPGSVSDLIILSSHAEVQISFLQNSAASPDLLDHGKHVQTYADSCTVCVIMNKTGF